MQIHKLENIKLTRNTFLQDYNVLEFYTRINFQSLTPTVVIIVYCSKTVVGSCIGQY